MTLDALLHTERPRLERRLLRMVRDPETAADRVPRHPEAPDADVADAAIAETLIAEAGRAA